MLTSGEVAVQRKEKSRILYETSLNRFARPQLKKTLNSWSPCNGIWEVRDTTQARWLWILIRESITSTLSEFVSNGYGEELMVYDGKAIAKSFAL